MVTWMERWVCVCGMEKDCLVRVVRGWRRGRRGWRPGLSEEGVGWLEEEARGRGVGDERLARREMVRERPSRRLRLRVSMVIGRAPLAFPTLCKV